MKNEKQTVSKRISIFILAMIMILSLFPFLNSLFITEDEKEINGIIKNMVDSAELNKKDSVEDAMPKYSYQTIEKKNTRDFCKQLIDNENEFRNEVQLKGRNIVKIQKKEEDFFKSCLSSLKNGKSKTFVQYFYNDNTVMEFQIIEQLTGKKKESFSLEEKNIIDVINDQRLIVTKKERKVTMNNSKNIVYFKIGNNSKEFKVLVNNDFYNSVYLNQDIKIENKTNDCFSFFINGEYDFKKYHIKQNISVLFHSKSESTFLISYSFVDEVGNYFILDEGQIEKNNKIKKSLLEKYEVMNEEDKVAFLIEYNFLSDSYLERLEKSFYIIE